MNNLELHRRAMNIAQKAHICSNPNDRQSLFKEAFELEKKVAMSYLNSQDEPTRSILFKSAAALARNAKLYEAAKYMVTNGLYGNPPSEIKEELFRLYKDILNKSETKLINTAEKNWQKAMAISMNKNIDFVITTYDERLSEDLVNQNITGKSLKLIMLGKGSSTLVSGASAVAGLSGIAYIAAATSIGALADPEPITKTVLIAISAIFTSFGSLHFFKMIKMLVNKKYNFKKIKTEDNEIFINCEIKKHC